MELLAPGGSFEKAIYALKGGADAVYAGLKRFSARACAENLSLSELIRLIDFAHGRRKRIYCAVNTLIKDKELDSALETIFRIAHSGIDGVIVQDIGLAAMIGMNFPGLSLHASTQMAIHNISGIASARLLGFKRIVLARELTTLELWTIRQNHPDLELEVFVHGARCYSFSGLCLASGMITGRSGNRGECAQICRNFFRWNDREAYYFSSKDMGLGERIEELRTIGIDSLKIEGRMKSPEYVHYTCAYYRALLDRKSDEDARQKSLIAFSRTISNSHLDTSALDLTVDSFFPYHRGISLGRVKAVSGRSFTMKLSYPLALHDGLQYLEGSSMAKAHRFAVTSLEVDRTKVVRAEKGVIVRICGQGFPRVGDEISLISSRSSDLPPLLATAFPFRRPEIGFAVVLKSDDKGNNLIFKRETFETAFLIVVDRAERPTDFKKRLTDLFSGSGQSWYRIGIESFSNFSVFADERIFIQPSVLKKIRRELISAFDDHLSRLYSKQDLSALDSARLGKPDFPSRRELSPLDSPLPFVSIDDGLKVTNLAIWNGSKVLPLHPLEFDDRASLGILRSYLSSNRSDPFLIGINGLAHLDLAEHLSDLVHVSFFIDIMFYVANRETLKMLRSRIPRLIFAYHWIEDQDPEDVAAAELVPIGSGFSPPLFIHRGCFKQGQTKGPCPKNCPRKFSMKLEHRNERFRILVKDCLTYLFLD